MSTQPYQRETVYPYIRIGTALNNYWKGQRASSRHGYFYRSFWREEILFFPRLATPESYNVTEAMPVASLDWRISLVMPERLQ